MAQKTGRRVRILQYKKLDRGVTAIDRRIESARILSELEKLGLHVKSMKCRVFENGRVLMYYNQRIGEPPTIKIGGQIVCGTVVFIHIDGGRAFDLTVEQIKAIRSAVKRINKTKE